MSWKKLVRRENEPTIKEKASWQSATWQSAAWQSASNQPGQSGVQHEEDIHTMSTSADVSAALADWQFIRSNTVEFIKSLGDKGLKQKLPRPGLNTFCMHFQEMVSVENAYITAIETRKMSFSEIPENDGFDGQESAEELLERLETMDSKLQDVVLNAPADLTIDWSEGSEKKVLASHLSNLSIHETFHLGQLIAFCYATDVDLPQFLVDMWALSPKKL